jgi:transcription initiation factor TFIIIB Brf1 subunit/transcription initiation factor TFIIB
LDDEAALTAKEIKDAQDKKAAAEQATKQAEQDALQAKQRQADVSSAAKALLADAMPELRKSMLEQLRAEATSAKKS